MRDRDEVLQRCIDLFDERARADEFSGAALIGLHGTPVVERSYGYASTGFGVRNRTDTVFNIGSMAKMFTAVSIAQLAEAGRLRFDDVVSRHLPDYPRDVADRVTIHHLLTHTSGMGSYWNDQFAAQRGSLRAVSDLLPLFRDEPLAFEPGARFGYSNAGFVVLGAMVERLSGVSYDTYLAEHLFGPAGMTASGCWALDEDVPNRAIGYVREEAAGDGVVFPRTNVLMGSVKGGPAGGISSTVYDLLLFAEALRGHRLLTADLTEQVLEPRVAMGPRGDARYAYGFGCHEVNGVRVVGHNGGAPGVGALLDIYLEREYTVALLSNCDPKGWMQVVHPLRLLLTGGL